MERLEATLIHEEKEKLKNVYVIIPGHGMIHMIQDVPAESIELYAFEPTSASFYRLNPEDFISKTNRTFDYNINGEWYSLYKVQVPDNVVKMLEKAISGE